MSEPSPVSLFDRLPLLPNTFRLVVRDLRHDPPCPILGRLIAGLGKNIAIGTTLDGQFGIETPTARLPAAFTFLVHDRRDRCYRLQYTEDMFVRVALGDGRVLATPQLRDERLVKVVCGVWSLPLPAVRAPGRLIMGHVSIEFELRYEPSALLDVRWSQEHGARQLSEEDALT